MAEEQHSRQPYSGVNTSLYSTLEAHSIQYLEKASILTDHGHYSKAQHIYDHDLSSQRLLPPVVLGLAELALKQYKMGACHI